MANRSSRVLGADAVSAPAKTQALEALVEAHAKELHLPAIRTRFRALAVEATREQQTPLAYLAALLEAEVQERAERRERRRLLDARFPILKRLEDFRFDENPKVPQATIAALAEGSWIDDRESIILIGESGTGKTMLATALANAVVDRITHKAHIIDIDRAFIRRALDQLQPILDAFPARGTLHD